MGGELAAFGEGLFECGRRLLTIIVAVAVDMELVGIAAAIGYCGLWICELVGLVFRAGLKRWCWSKWISREVG